MDFSIEISNEHRLLFIVIVLGRSLKVGWIWKKMVSCRKHMYLLVLFSCYNFRNTIDLRCNIYALGKQRKEVSPKNSEGSFRTRSFYTVRRAGHITATWCPHLHNVDKSLNSATGHFVLLQSKCKHLVGRLYNIS
jgi:hypothetical protein